MVLVPYLAFGSVLRKSLKSIAMAALAVVFAESAYASEKYASVVMDARTGDVLYSRYADKILHPASLTKMMTVYLAIQAVENGEIGIDQRVKISKFAAREPASKMHYRPGQRVTFRHLIRAAAVKSANDAATAIAEAVSGSEEAFAARMNDTARQMGMRNTQFKNAHGLTQTGHYSTARDMSILGRHMIYDYPDYYNLFSRISTTVRAGTLRNTNRRFLRAYSGADGIKTGFTSRSGYNLTASARRSGKRIIVTVFGGRSVATRNSHVAELMDKGFALASRTATLRKPVMPVVGFSRLSRVDTSVETAEQRRRRPGGYSNHLAEAVLMDVALSQFAEGDADPADIDPIAEVEGFDVDFERPKRRPSLMPGASTSSSEARLFSIRVGSFPNGTLASNHLFKTALMDFDSLSEATRTVKQANGRFIAMFEGLTPANADVACGRLQAREVTCEIERML